MRLQGEHSINHREKQQIEERPCIGPAMCVFAPRGKLITYASVCQKLRTYTLKLHSMYHEWISHDGVLWLLIF